jgi:hypothetical protein
VQPARRVVHQRVRQGRSLIQSWSGDEPETGRLTRAVPQPVPRTRKRSLAQTTDELSDTDDIGDSSARVQLKSDPRKRAGPGFSPVAQAQGKKLMSPTAEVGFHPFAAELKDWESGVPVDCGKNWEWTVIEQAVARGPHISAMTPEAIELVKEDVAYQVKAGYARVFTWAELKQMRPKKLKILPLAVIPQKRAQGTNDIGLVVSSPQSNQGRTATPAAWEA